MEHCLFMQNASTRGIGDTVFSEWKVVLEKYHLSGHREGGPGMEETSRATGHGPKRSKKSVLDLQVGGL